MASHYDAKAEPTIWRTPDALWAGEVRRYDAAHHIGCNWQSTDSATVPSPPRRRRDGPGPDNRGRLGTKRHVVDDRRGAPLGVVVSATNRTDMQLAEAVLDSLV